MCVCKCGGPVPPPPAPPHYAAPQLQGAATVPAAEVATAATYATGVGVAAAATQRSNSDHQRPARPHHTRTEAPHTHGTHRGAAHGHGGVLRVVVQPAQGGQGVDVLAELHKPEPLGAQGAVFVQPHSVRGVVEGFQHDLGGRARVFVCVCVWGGRVGREKAADTSDTAHGEAPARGLGNHVGRGPN